MVLGSINALGRIDILVNNAGILSSTQFPSITINEWHRMLKTNLDSVFYCSKVVSEHMIEHKSGSIVNIGSSLSSRGGTFNFSGGGPDYVTSKAAIQALSRSMAQFLAPYGVRVNTLSPGPVDSPMHSGHRNLILKFIPYIPLGRLQVCDDLVGPLVFLVSDASRFITGQNLHVNGGMIMID